MKSITIESYRRPLFSFTEEIQDEWDRVDLAFERREDLEDGLVIVQTEAAQAAAVAAMEAHVDSHLFGLIGLKCIAPAAVPQQSCNPPARQ